MALGGRLGGAAPVRRDSGRAPAQRPPTRSSKTLNPRERPLRREGTESGSSGSTVSALRHISSCVPSPQTVYFCSSPIPLFQVQLIRAVSPSATRTGVSYW